MAERAEILAIEAGSTVTKAVAFDGERILARAAALTTPEDVSVGLARALAELESAHGVKPESAGRVYAASSAGGGLRVTVHGLTRDLTARAAEEASLGAGANVQLITAGRLGRRELGAVGRARPNLMVLAGGVEHGEEATVLANARALCRLRAGCPVVYAGNAVLRDEVRAVFEQAGRELWVVENVYPRFDELNVGPVRAVIQKLFAERLVLAPGTDELRRLAGGRVTPVPAACLQAAEVLAGAVGDLVVVDVGGATTDVHSVIDAPSPGNPDPQVRSRRTVEGDLGTYISAPKVWAALGRSGEPQPLAAVPATEAEAELSRELAGKAAELALVRHAGVFLPGSRLPDGGVPVRGRDLRSARLVVGTGGGLAALDGGAESLRRALSAGRRGALLPPEDAEVRVDRDYVFSACGTFAGERPELARRIMLRSIGGV